MAAGAILVPLSHLPRAQTMAGTPQALFKDLRWRNSGPANMGGRISDIEALDSDFSTVLVAAASGSIWKNDASQTEARDRRSGARQANGRR
jgi:hypothetical protein